MATRKIVIDLDLKADDEETLDAIQADLEATFLGAEDVTDRLSDGRTVKYRITAFEIINEGPVEV